jgi:hypothetical protein
VTDVADVASVSAVQRHIRKGNSGHVFTTSGLSGRGHLWPQAARRAPKIVHAARPLRRKTELPTEFEPYGTPVVACSSSARFAALFDLTNKQLPSRSPHRAARTPQALSPSSLHRPSLTRRFTISFGTTLSPAA